MKVVLSLGRWRKVVPLPSWLLVTVLVVSMALATYGWASSAYSLVMFISDIVRLVFQRLGLVALDLSTIIEIALWPWAIIPVLAAFAYLRDINALGPRLGHILGLYWATFLLQVLVIPLVLGNQATVNVCTPVSSDISGFDLSIFLYGLIEGHVPLLTTTLYFIGRSNVQWVKVFLYIGTVFETLLLVTVPAAVRWWLPVMVCDNPGISGCEGEYRNGFYIGLCKYPLELVVTIYLNIALSLTPRLWALLRQWVLRMGLARRD